MQALLNADAAILLFFQENIRCGFLNVIMVFFTTLGNAGLLWLGAGVIMAATKKYRRAGITLLLCVAACWVVNNLLIKNLVARQRPFEVFDWLEVLISLPKDYSFPSGHACSSFAAAYALTYSFGKRAALVYVVAALIAVSRIYVGVHYPSDVIVGIIIGTLGSMLVCALLARRRSRT